jgi:hypothetical protein
MSTHISPGWQSATLMDALNDEPSPYDRLAAIDDLVQTGRATYERMCQLDLERAELAVRVGTTLAQAEATGCFATSPWPLFTGGHGPSEYSADDLLAIHRLGLDAHAVLELGGIEAAGRWARRQNLPGLGEVLTITLQTLRQDRPRPVVCIWPAGAGHCLGHLPSRDAEAGEVVTLDPIIDERLVWQHLWLLLGRSYDLLSTAGLEHSETTVAQVLEKQRKEKIRVYVDRVLEDFTD